MTISKVEQTNWKYHLSNKQILQIFLYTYYAASVAPWTLTVTHLILCEVSFANKQTANIEIEQKIHKHHCTLSWKFEDFGLSCSKCRLNMALIRSKDGPRKFLYIKHCMDMSNEPSWPIALSGMELELSKTCLKYGPNMALAWCHKLDTQKKHFP